MVIKTESKNNQLGMESMSLPQQRKRTSPETEDSDDIESNCLSPRKKPCSTASSPVKKGGARSSTTSTSLSAATEEDRMVFRMKEKEGKSWSEIRDEWERMTGAKVTANLVRKRYCRMKANFEVFADEDVTRLSEANRAFDEEMQKMERERFSRIAKAIVAAGGQSYSGATVQKKLKEIGRS